MPAPLKLATLVALALVVLAGSARARAQDEAKKVTFADDIAPIFQAHCNACHNADKKRGGLILDNFAAMMAGGASGEVIEAGDADNSRLFLVVNHDEEPIMPPGAPKIPDDQIEALKRWIDAGAPETSGSVVAVKPKAKLDFKVDPSSIGKPAGEPAMPEGVSTEPAVLSPRPNAITALAASPWAPLIAISGHKQVLLYNTETRRLAAVLPFPEGNIASLKFTRDGDLLMAGGGRGGQTGRVVVWDVKTGERAFEVGNEYDTVLAADISPDRSLIALGGPSKILRVYNTSDGSLVYEAKKHTEWVTAIGFSPDGVLLASGDRNGGLIVWESESGQEFHDLRNHTAMISDVSWRLDSNVLASASEDGTIRLWEMENGTQVKNWNAHGGGALSVRFAKDGRLVSTGRDRLTKTWNADGAVQKQFDAFPDVATQASFSHDDALVVAGDFSGEVRLLDPAEGTLLGALAANPEPVATRLEKANAALAEAQAAHQAAAAELAALQADADAKAAALAAAESALAVAQQAEAEAKAAADAAQASVAAARLAEQEAGKTASAADFARDQAIALRTTALRELSAQAEAARLAESAAARTGDARDRMLAETAVAELAARTERLAAALPAWAAAIEAATAPRQALDRAGAARIAAEAGLPLLRHRAAVAASAVPPAQAALAAAQQARTAATEALAARQPEAEAKAAAVAALQAEAAALTAERQAQAAKAEASALAAPAASN